MKVLQKYTKEKVTVLTSKTEALEEKVSTCVLNCDDKLNVIKGKEIERAVALDKLINDSKKRAVE